MTTTQPAKCEVSCFLQRSDSLREVVFDTWMYGGLMAPGARSKFGAPVVEPEVFRDKMYSIEESTCDIVGLFGATSVIPLTPLVTLFKWTMAVFVMNSGLLCCKILKERCIKIDFSRTYCIIIFSWIRKAFACIPYTYDIFTL